MMLGPWMGCRLRGKCFYQFGLNPFIELVGSLTSMARIVQVAHVSYRIAILVGLSLVCSRYGERRFFVVISFFFVLSGAECLYVCVCGIGGSLRWFFGGGGDAHHFLQKKKGQTLIIFDVLYAHHFSTSVKGGGGEGKTRSSFFTKLNGVEGTRSSFSTQTGRGRSSFATKLGYRESPVGCLES